MLPALTFDDVLRRSPAFGTREDMLGQRLVSVVLANPGSRVWADLETNRAFLDARSGTSWDLFFAGMSGYRAMEPGATQIGGFANGGTRWFNPGYFNRIERAIRVGHQTAGAGLATWMYSGGTDLVSFMVYERRPDWLTLRSVRIDEASPLSLGEVTEGLREWREGRLAVDLAPGELETRLPVSLPLGSALIWMAATLVGGSLGNGGYDLLKMLLER